MHIQSPLEEAGTCKVQLHIPSISTCIECVHGNLITASVFFVPIIWQQQGQRSHFGPMQRFSWNLGEIQLYGVKFIKPGGMYYLCCSPLCKLWMCVVTWLHGLRPRWALNNVSAGQQGTNLGLNCAILPRDASNWKVFQRFLDKKIEKWK